MGLVVFHAERDRPTFLALLACARKMTGKHAGANRVGIQNPEDHHLDEQLNEMHAILSNDLTKCAFRCKFSVHGRFPEAS
jgi:hypothetical protein